MEEASFLTRTNRHSWGKNPDEYAVSTKARNLNGRLEHTETNGDHSDDPYELLQVREDQIHELEEELQKALFQNHELQDALSEAQTIIDQQQDQLTEFRRIAAQSQTDAEAFKMKNMFLNSESRSHDENLHAVASACERLEAEVEALTWQLDQSRKMQIRLQNERDYLQRQLDDMKEAETLHENDAQLKPDHLQNANPNPDNVNGHDTNGFVKPEAQLVELENAREEIQQLHTQLDQLQQKEAQWKNVSETLIEKQRKLEDEKIQQATVIDQLQNELNAQIPTEEQSINHDVSEASNISNAFRDINEERSRWKLYACSLVRLFVENCEEFIQKTPYQEPMFETLNERRWYTYAMQLLENILDVAPNRLTQMDLQLLKRSLSTRRPVADFHENNSPSADERQLLSAACFPRQSIASDADQPTGQRRVARLASLPIQELAQS